MARSDVAVMCAAIRDATGIPYVYRQWPKGSTPEWPSIEYHLDGDGNFAADNHVHAPIDRWALSLYSERKEDALEDAVEAVLNARGLYWTKDEITIDGEGLLQVEYGFSLPR